ncbi:MAG TPA: hypothetical protein DET40_00360 [Lentisphaeria bacterium]|nr:MAG: hypothetical protein A2X45_10725 [Lentisphaerae bacterium GWF2_50_93]HCE41985.1 hypothetical protein [Lentisphaeria bacterium]
MEKKSPILGSFCLVLLFAGISSAVFSADYKNRVVKEIENSAHFYLKRSSPQWEKQGRIIGEVAYPPKAYTIDIFIAGTKLLDKPLKTISPNPNLTVYDTGWLAAGTYDIVVKSAGYVDHHITAVKITPYSDCVINLVFGQIEYKRQ